MGREPHAQTGYNGSVSTPRPETALPLALAALLLLACKQDPPAPSSPPAEAEVATPVPGRIAPPPAERPTLPAAAADPTPRLHLLRTSGRAAGPLPYLVVEPAGGVADLPLLVALHGRGARADRFASLVEDLALPVRAIVARGPLPFGRRGGRQWFDLSAPGGPDQVRARVSDLTQLLHKLRERYPGAPKPVLMGFSQGAMLALQMLADAPEHLGGVVALSGRLPLEPGAEKAAANPPALLTTGTADHIITPQSTRAAARVLSARGHGVEVFEFQGGHGVPTEVLDRVRAFLLARWPALGTKPAKTSP